MADTEAARHGCGVRKPSRRPRGTIGAVFSDQHNSLNFLRLVLALAVMVSHAIVLGGFGDEGILHHTTLGSVAVYGFFGLSGFLIAGSATRNRVGRYVWQRFLRIFPGFWVCLIVTAFLFGVIGWNLGLHHCDLSCYVGSRRGPFQYVVNNFFLRMNQYGIAGTPRGVPSPGAWDGSLWTLLYEFLCYLLLAGLALVGLLRLRRRHLVAGLACGVWLLEAAVATRVVSPHLHSDTISMLTFTPIFLAGSVLCLYRDKVPDAGVLALACVLLFISSLWLPLEAAPSAARPS
jgi:peptidoglycan/LPS O-acetylase OafA/YrhL